MTLHFCHIFVISRSFQRNQQSLLLPLLYQKGRINVKQHFQPSDPLVSLQICRHWYMSRSSNRIISYHCNYYLDNLCIALGQLPVRSQGSLLEKAELVHAPLPTPILFLGSISRTFFKVVFPSLQSSMALTSSHTVCRDASQYQLGLFSSSTNSNQKLTEFDNLALHCAKIHAWQLQVLSKWAAFEAQTKRTQFPVYYPSMNSSEICHFTTSYY